MIALFFYIPLHLYAQHDKGGDIVIDPLDKKTPLFDPVEEYPQFPGGLDSLKGFVSHHLNFSVEGKSGWLINWSDFLYP